MLKEIFIIITILIIIFTAHIAITKYLEKTTDKLIGKVESISINTKDNIDAAKLEIKNFQEEWDNAHKTWSIIISHQELDQIELALVSASIAIENVDIDEALIELGKLNFLLEHIKDKEGFKLKNIF